MGTMVAAAFSASAACSGGDGSGVDTDATKGSKTPFIPADFVFQAGGAKNLVLGTAADLALPPGAFKAGVTNGETHKRRALGDAARTCALEPRNWNIVSVRFAPYELAVAGVPSTINAFGLKTRKVNVDKVMQLRVALRTTCGQGDGAIHVVYNLSGGDSGVRAALDAAHDYTLASLTGNVNAAKAALTTHFNMFDGSTPVGVSYGKLRGKVFADLAKVLSQRTTSQSAMTTYSSSIARLQKTLEESPAGAAIAEDPLATRGARDAVNPALELAGGPLASAIVGFVKTYAAANDLAAMATMYSAGPFGTDGGSWIFRSGAARGGVLLPVPDVATPVFTSIANGDVLTLRAFLQDKDFDEQAVAPTDPALLALFNAQTLLLKSGSSVANEAEYRAKMLSPSTASPTAAQCFQCHAAADGTSIRLRGEQYDFHMLSSGHMNARTSAEIVAEATRANLEFGGGYARSTPAPPASVKCTVDSVDGFINLRELNSRSGSTDVITTINNGQTLSILASNASSYVVDVEGYMSQSVMRCISPNACQAVANAGGSPVKTAGGKTAFVGQTIRATGSSSGAQVGSMPVETFTSPNFVVGRLTPQAWYPVRVHGTIGKGECK
jgi:hypothetical protein